VGGHWSGAKVGRHRKKHFWCAPPLFGANRTISRFGERFRDGQYSLVSFFFAVLLLTVPPVPNGVDATDRLCRLLRTSLPCSNTAKNRISQIFQKVVKLQAETP